MKLMTAQEPSSARRLRAGQGKDRTQLQTVAVLPPELANQIAAGEVVERPASVIKELVENSLDAGATRVEITIEEGGQRLIRIDDDGCGMTREDALRALERHATSKIATVDDLFAISTLGFRGEALPSIASVSHMELRTKPHGALSGTKIVVRGGKVESIDEIGMAGGTTLIVQELFYNTPARLKFLKTTATESRHITEMLSRLALSRPDVRFVLRRDGKTILDLPIAPHDKDRVLSVLGREVYDDMFETFHYPSIHGITASGFFTKPSHRQRTPNNIYMFVNGRYVTDKTIRSAIMGAYGTLMESGRYPSVVMFVDVPYDMVDVNVHPAKFEVRFHDSNSVYRAVYHAIADALAQTPWVAHEALIATGGLKPSNTTQKDTIPTATPTAKTYGLKPFAPAEPGGQRTIVSGQIPSHAAPPRIPAGLPADRLSPNVVEHRAAGTPEIKLWSRERGFEPAPVQQGFTTPGLQPLPQHVDPQDTRQAPFTPPPDAVGAVMDTVVAPAPVDPNQGGYFTALRIIGQFKRQYIVCEDATGLVIIDQHAAHERIGYERLKKLFATEHKETQPLLFPRRIELDTLRTEVLAENLEFFAQAGFEIDHFGGQTYVLKSVPAVLQKADFDKLLRDILDDLAYYGRTTRLDEAMDAVCARMACHAVVRGPTTLTEAECYGLFEQMDAIDFKANCPHGRPVYFRITQEELEMSFERR
jgi:DNA mismatch repair protein MutL